MQHSKENEGTFWQSGKLWYHHLVRSPDKGDRKFLLSTSPRHVLSQDSGAKGGTKAYTSFPDHQSMLYYCEKHPNHGYYEHLILNGDPRKLYFDIDHEVPRQEKEQWVDMHRKHLGLLIHELVLMFGSAHLPFTPADIRIYHSCGEKGDMYKFSFHVVTVGYAASDPEHVKEICHQIRERVASDAPHCGIHEVEGKSVKNWIDSAPYGCRSGGQAFRMFGSAKLGSSRKKLLLRDVGCPPDSYTLYDMMGNPTHYSRQGVWGTEAMEALICHPVTVYGRTLIPTTVYPPSKTVVATEFISVDNEKMEMSLVEIVKRYPQLEGVFVVDPSYPGRLNRVPGMSALCPVCDRVHDSVCAFIQQRKNGNIAFACPNAEEGRKTLLIDGLYLATEEEEDEEDSDEEDSDEEEEETIEAPPSRENVKAWSEAERAMSCYCSRIAYRETPDFLNPNKYYANSMSPGMETAPSAFASRLPNPIYSNEYYGRDADRCRAEEGGIERTPTDAGVVITVIEHLVNLTKDISAQFKLFGARLVLFSTGNPASDQRAVISFRYFLPSVGKVFTTGISVAELLSGEYINGNKWSGTIPAEFTPLMKSKLSNEYSARRLSAYRFFERCYTKLGNPCTIPFFRGQPAPLPEITSVNVFKGFNIDPLRHMKRYRSVAEFEATPQIKWFRTLLLHGISSGDIADFETAMNFLAYPISHLDSPKTGKCMIVIGDYGTGKSTVGNIMNTIYGDLAINTNMSRITGTFNGSLSGCIFAMLDEPEPTYNSDGTVSAQQKAESTKYASRLKELITGEKMQLEDKYASARSEDMSVNFYLSSNNFDIGVIDVNPNTKDRRPIVYDSRTCCCRAWVDGDGVRQEYFYFYATGKSNECVNTDGNPVYPHPTPKEIEADKTYFYRTFLELRRSPDFHDMVAAYLLTYAQEHDTSTIHHFNQNPLSPALRKMRELNVSHASRFMMEICGTEFTHTGSPKTLICNTPGTLRPHIIPDQDGILPNSYFIGKTDLYVKIFKPWFAERNSGFRVPTQTEFEKDLSLYCTRNTETVDERVRVGKIDRRVKVDGVNTTGICFLTRGTFYPNDYGAQTSTGTMPQQNATAQVDWQKMFEESERKRAEDMEAMKAMFADALKLTQGK